MDTLSVGQNFAREEIQPREIEREREREREKSVVVEDRKVSYGIDDFTGLLLYQGSRWMI